ncbi:MAG: M20/M25/M40 family metallo-hydrolase [Candidatus Lokiarchaeota archaeon]|nr:M20/M25/M40 family metallo-hydrolase [Candidatus Lokiarchaeota archaeon]
MKKKGNKEVKKEILNRLPKFLNNTKEAQETIEMLQFMLRHDTTNPPGNELKLAKTLKGKMDAINCDFISSKLIETAPNRGNLIIHIHGTEPNKHPIWGFGGHLDVVPVSGVWEHDPFSGEIVQEEHDKFIWGRGAFDMKQIDTAIFMAPIFLIRENWRPKGDIKIILNADEEAGGHKGMEILVDKYWEDVKVDCLIDESGGFKLPIGHDIVIQRAEKGKCQTKLKVMGISGHGSIPPPYEEFAIYELVAILNKIRKKKQRIYITEEYCDALDHLSLPKILKLFMKSRFFIRPLIQIGEKFTKLPFRKILLPLVMDTISPTIIRAGQKVNVISPNAELSLDIRILPGHDTQHMYNELKRLLGKELYSNLELEAIDHVPASNSPPETKYYNKIEEILKKMYPKANLVPIIATGGTDMKYFRWKGVPCYGFSPTFKDEDLSVTQLTSLAHAPNERISVTNLMIATEWVYRMMRSL